MLTKVEIADYLKRMKEAYAGYSTALTFLNYPDTFDWLLKHGMDPGSTVQLGRQDNTYYENLDLYHSINLIRSNPQFNLDGLGVWIMIIISSVGHFLKEQNYFERTPELEFFRHLRNAIDHGNKFHFEKGQPNPKYPAHFKNFKIDSSLQGKALLFEYMSTGDFFDLFDYLENYLIK